MVRGCSACQGQGGELVAAAAALAVVTAQGKTAEELELLSSFFNMLGENLATMAIKAPSAGDCCPAQEENRGRC